MKPMITELPYDVARCNGRIAVGNELLLCTRRDTCLRWLAVPATAVRTCNILVAGRQNVIDCEYYIPQGGSDEIQRAAEST